MSAKDIKDTKDIKDIKDTKDEKKVKISVKVTETKCKCKTCAPRKDKYKYPNRMVEVNISKTDPGDTNYKFYDIPIHFRLTPPCPDYLKDREARPPFNGTWSNFGPTGYQPELVYSWSMGDAYLTVHNNSDRYGGQIIPSNIFKPNIEDFDAKDPHKIICPSFDVDIDLLFKHWNSKHPRGPTGPPDSDSDD